MAGNSNLHMSKDAREDEYYTDLVMIENEIKHYRSHFRGKTVFCNCDDPYESNFFKYCCCVLYSLYEESYGRK